MIDEVLPNVYRVEVPLPQNPLRAVNCYVFKTQDRTLIVDTGQNREECMSVMSAALAELGVDLKKTDFYITHLHVDHVGLVPRLATETSTVYFNQPDAIISNREHVLSHWDSTFEFAHLNGFPDEALQKARSNHPALRYGMKCQMDFHIVKEGDIISIGDYSFKCIETPGHTNGHICLYDASKKVFVSGDHILSDITPNIQLWSNDRNALDEYLGSLDKVYPLEVALVLPGHRTPFRTFRERINELKHHHDVRANEALSVLKRGSQTAFQVASQMTWDIDCKSWEEFPGPQKWFATGETIAHLKYLEVRGKIRRVVRDGTVVFSLS